MSGSAHSTPRTARATDTWAIGTGLFVLALLVRTLFAAAGPDADWPHSVHYKGDAIVWLRHVMAERAGQPFEAGVPLRPPGMAWLVGALWDGTPEGVATVKFAWRILGAATVALLFAVVERGFTRTVAITTCLLFAFSSGSLVISGSLNNETPYLLLVVATLLAQPARTGAIRPGRAFVWGALHAAACLVRVEHALFFALILVYVGFARRRTELARGTWVGLSAGALGFVLALVPWHVTAWSRIAEFNRGEVPKDPGAERAIASIERATRGVRWHPQALAAAERLPGFIRRSSKSFIAATVQMRGGEEVGPADLAILEEAFGYRPEAIAAHPFVSSYGPLNFYLANNPRAEVGFSRAGLEEPPPLAGGAERYPAALVQGLPPDRLSFEYPPHLAIFNHGYRRGFAWIAGHPLDWLALSARKLGVFWRGASTGFGGYNVPVGASGTRRAVDIVTPEHVGATLWRALIAAAAIAGLAAGLAAPDTRRALGPWLLYSASKLAVCVLFFGYARQGVLILPVVHLALALACARWLTPRLGKHGPRAGLILAAGLLALEGVRRAGGVEVTIDGLQAMDTDPIPADAHGEREIRFGPPAARERATPR